MKIMSVDFGDARTGIAACDKTEFLASPVSVISEWNYDKKLRKIADIAKEISAELIIMGHPVNMDGSIGERAEKCKKAADDLKQYTDLEVILWDERQTTVEAHRILHDNGKKEKDHRKNVDAVAAVLILENYLEYRKNHRD